MIKTYDFLIVGAGLFGATCAYLLSQQNKKVLVIDKRNHIGGNIYTELNNGIFVHKYGAHIFHTSNKDIWDFVNQFATFEPYTHNVIANYKGELYNLPFNMNTFKQLYNISTVDELNRNIDNWNNYISIPTNIEEYAIKHIGNIGYTKLIKGYTEKQWGISCDKLPVNILKRIPIRKNWDNNYFDDIYQGIPIDGYTSMIFNMLKNVDVELNTTFDINIHYNIANNIIYCGSLDALLNNCLGELPYRYIQLVEKYNIEYPYNTPVTNFTDIDIPYTRIINHKLFLNSTKSLHNTILSFEYVSYSDNDNAICAYPIQNTDNLQLYAQYVHLLKTKYPKIIPGGRLGLYKYIDMDDTIEAAFQLIQKGGPL